MPAAWERKSRIRCSLSFMFPCFSASAAAQAIAVKLGAENLIHDVLRIRRPVRHRRFKCRIRLCVQTTGHGNHGARYGRVEIVDRVVRRIKNTI